MEDFHLLSEEYEIPSRCPKIQEFVPYGACVFFFIAFLFTLGGATALLFYARNPDLSLSNVIHSDSLEVHLKNLDLIAKRMTIPGRSVNHGFNESAFYVMRTLYNENKKRCNIWRQYFQVPVYEQINKPSLTQIKPTHIKYKHEIDFLQMHYGGKGHQNITASLKFLDFLPARGCNLTDFENSKDALVVISSDTSICSLYDKSLNAQKSGVKGVLFQQTAESGNLLTKQLINFKEWTYDLKLIDIPVFSVSFLVGKTLRTENFIDKTVILNLHWDTKIEMEWTFNVFCDFFEKIHEGKKEKPSKKMIVIGGHLDSSSGSPGLNDNGSGVAALLEMAIQFFNLGIALDTSYEVRFAFWGAGEVGSFGSKYYVSSLFDPSSVVAYVNLDTLASPNYIRGIFDGRTASNPAIRPFSAKISQYYRNYFDKQKEKWKNLPMDSMTQNDFVPFINAGIPVGGMTAGSTDIKSIEERNMFQGIADAELDPCHHKPCDSLENVNLEALTQLAKATADLIEKLVYRDDNLFKE
eukprot:gene4016-7272_t